MAELSTLARPYAKAVFEFAEAGNDLAGWSAQLATAAAVAGTETLQRVFGSPAMTSEQQADAFIEVCGDELGDKGRNFIRVLAENKRLALLPEIQKLYEQFKANREKSVAVEVATPFELDEELQQKLATALSGKLEREVSVQSVIDKSLIGGVVVRAADVVIDGSVRGRLAKLAETMNS
jgi:F-type H+-transporting ATPase subunit delta